MSTTITDILTAPGLGAFFYDDQRAIRAGAQQEGFSYLGVPQTEGFDAIRMPARSLGIGLLLEDGHVAWGDMMSVQYAGAGGRERVFNTASAQALVNAVLTERLQCVALDSFRAAETAVLAPTANGSLLPLSVEYGVSQALLRAVAHVQRRPMAAVLAEEFGVPLVARPVPIYAQSGDERRLNVEKMVLKRVDVLPHGLVNSPAKLGEQGEVFLDYVRWVRDTVFRLGGSDYRPTLHFDVYGTVGLVFGHSIARMAEYLLRLADAAAPLAINIESPGDFGGTRAQVDGFAALRKELQQRSCGLRVVADEWCDTLEDVRLFVQAQAADIIQIKTPDMGRLSASMEAALLCKGAGVGAYLGGSCVETDLSARASVHVAVACQADMQLAKPGMGVDEALSIVGNEQARLLATICKMTSRPTVRNGS
jgi:methylaspartate ammonia-lyase